MPATFVPSPQQAAIFDWVAKGSGSAIVRAVAGAGKTTTLIEAMRVMQGSIAVMSFAKAISVEIGSRVERLNLGNRAKCGTVHSFGFSALRSVYRHVKLDARQRDAAVLNSLELSEVGIEKYGPIILKLVSLAKQRAAGVMTEIGAVHHWYDIVEHFSLEDMLPENSSISLDQIVNDAIRALRWSRDNVETINFDDMIWLPLIHDCRFPKSDWVLVDEAQDLNAARRAIARRMLKPQGRAIFVGDEAQAIFGFTGADSESMNLIASEFNAPTLPLTVTYRCPKSVVAKAQTWVSHIEAHESAPQGVVETTTQPELFTVEKVNLTADAAILCRNTEPLVKLAYQFLRDGIPCHVEGRDIGKDLIALLTKWKSIGSLDSLHDKLEDYMVKGMARAEAKGDGNLAQSIEDKVTTLFVIMKQCSNVSGVIARINSLFQDSESMPIKNLTLATIHRSKGREWPTVYWLGSRAYSPSRYARKDWELVQENNLCYVVATRAMSRLVEIEVSEGDKG